MLRKPEIHLLLVDFGVGGMLDAWTEISSGWIWCGVTVVGLTGLVLLHVNKPKHVVSNGGAGANPSNGWLVACAMMQARTLDEVEDHYRRFMGEKDGKDEKFVHAALRARRLRDERDTWDVAWDYFDVSERIGIEDYLTATEDLERRFPEPLVPRFRRWWRGKAG